MKARLRYTGIRVRDLDASVRFYTSVLGMTASEPVRFAETHGTVVDLVSEGTDHPLELNHYDKGSPFDTPFEAGEALDHLGFRVADLDRAIADAREAGYPVVEEVRAGGSRWVYLRDPNGVWIELSADPSP